MGLPRYFWYYFLIPGALMLIGAFTTGFEVWKAERSIARTEGVVIRNHVPGAAGFSTELKFSTPDGKTYTFVSQTTSANAYDIGRKLTVAYDIDDPEHAKIDARSQAPWIGPIVFAIWGLIITSVGAIPIALGARKKTRADWLKQNGRSVDATFSGVLRNPDLAIDGKHPYRIGAQWTNPATGKLCQFMSDNLWTDPSAHMTSRTIRVLIDPNNVKRYWMDLTFLASR
jgi:hypothetical protein